MNKKVHKALRRINKFYEIIAVSIFSCIIVLILLGAFFRYIVEKPLFWTEEIIRLLFVWMTFIGATVAHQNMKHPAINIFIQKLKERPQKIMIFVTNIIIVIFFLLFAVYGTRLVYVMRGSSLPATRISYFYLYISIPVSMFMLVINQIDLIIQCIAEVRKDKEMAL